jgi:SAM-dependent methyltransferase
MAKAMATATGHEWRAHLPELRLNAVSPYFTMFPLDFPGPILAGARAGDWVLDPFCGRGTTLFAARRLGLPAVGIDTNRVAVATSAAKLTAATPHEVISLAESLLATRPAREQMRGEFWRLCYHPHTLRQLRCIRDGLIELEPTSPVIVLRALMLGILHGPLRKGQPAFLSNQMPRTYATKPSAAVRYWTARDQQPPHVDLIEVLSRRAHYSLASQPAPVQGQVHHGDARDVLPRLDRKFTWVITSPPYVGMRTYVADQWLRNWFLGGPSEVEYADPDSIRSSAPSVFSDQLADALRKIADVCLPDARLVLRFGALPSVACDPGSLIAEALGRAEAGWRLQGVRAAGLPRRGMRQASQMGTRSASVEEVDCYAVLAG